MAESILQGLGDALAMATATAFKIAPVVDRALGGSGTGMVKLTCSINVSSAAYLQSPTIFNLIGALINQPGQMDRNATAVLYAETVYKNNDKEQAQYLLNHMGFEVYDTKEPKGQMGVGATSAVILFQKYSRLQVTGSIDGVTLQKLKESTLNGVNRIRIIGSFKDASGKYNLEPADKPNGNNYENGYYTGDLARIPNTKSGDTYGDGKLQSGIAVAWALAVQGAIDFNKTVEGKKAPLDIDSFGLSGSDAGYRDYHKQVEAWAYWKVYKGDKPAPPDFSDNSAANKWIEAHQAIITDSSWDCIPDKWTSPGEALYGTRGTSNHGSNEAVDLYIKPGSNELTWLNSHADEYGFTKHPTERWHWNYLK